MEQKETHLQDVLAFIREHRSNPMNFRKLEEKLGEELRNSKNDPEYHAALSEIQNKYASGFTEAREQNGQAWPEFENFIANFERSVIAEMKKAA